MRRFPPYPSRPHSRGKARIAIDGKSIYLDGAHGSPESWSHYRRLLAAWSAGAPIVGPAASLSVADLASAYLEHVAEYYGDSRERGNIRDSLKPLLRMLADDLAADMGPAKLKAVREAMVSGSWLTEVERKKRAKAGHLVGLCRKTANQRTGRIVRMWRWAAENELVPASVWHALQAVEGLRAGRSKARESTPVPPVPILNLAKTLGKLSPVVAAMVRVQLLTGMRPGEVCRLSWEEIDRKGAVWVYRPAKHKTLHHGHGRAIAIGPRAQRILCRYKTDSGPVFSPHGANARSQQYTPMTYGREIQRGAARAGVPHWTPNQIRHTAATEIEEQHGLDAARAALGHRTQDITKVYAAADLSIASKVAHARG